MLDALIQLGLFSAKTFILVIFILLLLVGILALLSRSKETLSGKIQIKNLNEKLSETTEALFSEVLPKNTFKKWLKEKNRQEKEKNKTETTQKNIFVLDFQGDIKASAVACLREEVTAILGIANTNDEVVVLIESPGGMVHTYGLAAAQLQRIRQRNIPLTVIVDKVAASGGYLMACVANKIIAAPFAIIGSIGVIVQMPNFHRLLKEKNIDFEQLTAGNFKRTLTIFGQNTEEGREKLQEEIEDIHGLFKNLIHQHRQQLDIEKVATGEHWLGTQALELKLVDELQTSDDYLLERCANYQIYEVNYHLKKSLASRLTSTMNVIRNSFSNHLM